MKIMGTIRLVRRRGPTTTRRRTRKLAVLALILFLQQHYLIFLAGGTSVAEEVVEPEEADAVSTSSDAVVVVVQHQQHDESTTPMETNNNEAGAADAADAAAAAAAVFDSHDDDDDDVEDAVHGDAAYAEDGDGVFASEAILTPSSPPDNVDHHDEHILREHITISSSNYPPNSVGADEREDVVVDAANVAADSAVGDEAKEQLDATNEEKINQHPIENNEIRNPPDHEEETIDRPPTMHPTSTTTATTDATDAAGTTTADTTSSSHNPTIASISDKHGNERNNWDETIYQQIMYNSIFQSNIMEYDMMKFDPFSFSGAPLGGWGRATRSRLATLPIRLVVGNDGTGGIPLIYGDAVSGGESNEDAAEDVVTPSDNNGAGEGNEVRLVGSESTLPSPSSSPSSIARSKHDSTSGVRRSTGPHFTIHDSTGQKYVCRAYAEDELIVRSRIDSAFNPAITIWDNAGHDKGDISGADERSGPAEGLIDHVQKNTKKPLQTSFHFNVKSGVVGADDTKKLSETIRTSVAKLLRKLRMPDAADELLGLDIDLDGEGVVLTMDDTIEVGNDDGTMTSEIANIIKAAAVGAGKGSLDNIDNNEGSKVESSSSSSTTSPQLTPDQIIGLVQTLQGTCSQFHNGDWWSYELCHLQQFRQFHVAITNDSSGMPKYEIRDVSLVGKFSGELQIIYPKGVYDGEFVKGSITSVKYDDMGSVRDVHTEDRNLPDVDLYPTEITNFDNANGNHRIGAPIVMHRFEGGDFCDEVGYNRQAHNEMYCCTESFIDRWLGANNRRKPNGETPQAIVLSVQEVGPCNYRSKVCTPLLCPRRTAESSASDIETTAATATTLASPEKTSSSEQQLGKGDDAIGTLLNAVFGKDAPELGEIRIYFPDELTGQEFDELVRQANEGIDITNNPSFQLVKSALRKLTEGGDHDAKVYSLNIKDLLLGNDDDNIDTNNSGGDKFSSSDKVGGSIREILNKSLGTRMCLEKVIGWWTYEFCHGKQIRQYHVSNVIDFRTRPLKAPLIETEHILGVYQGSGNSLEDYPNEDERLHVINAAGRSSLTGENSNPDKENEFMAKQQQSQQQQSSSSSSSSHAGGNGAIYVQEYKFGEVCDHEDVAMSVIKGGNVLHGSVERSSTVRFMCGKRRELVDVKEDRTCHYILDVTVPELCNYKLFRAEVMKTQVVKCLPV